VTQEDLDSQARNAPLTRPRPGHADLAGMQKFGHTDARPILERASARETAARVALGEVAKRMLDQALGVKILSHVVSLGAVAVPDDAAVPEPADLAAIDQDPVRCADAATSARMIAEVDAARKDGDTLGGVVEVVVHGLPPGLGSFTQWDRKRSSPSRRSRAWRSATDSPPRPGAVRAPTTRSTSARTGCAGAPTGPAGSRAACPPAR
jgi:chorismate synthase